MIMISMYRKVKEEDVLWVCHQTHNDFGNDTQLADTESEDNEEVVEVDHSKNLSEEGVI